MRELSTVQLYWEGLGVALGGWGCRMHMRTVKRVWPPPSPCAQAIQQATATPASPLLPTFVGNHHDAVARCRLQVWGLRCILRADFMR